jgi:peroxiredoxin
MDKPTPEAASPLPLKVATPAHRPELVEGRIRGVCLMVMSAVLALPLIASAAAAPKAMAPDFTLRQIDGPNLRLGEQRGRVVMVNFWATWCGPCRVELPQLARLHEKYRASGLVLLGVNIDEDPNAARALAGKLGLKFPVLLDSDKKVVGSYDLNAMPATVLIDKDGRVRHLHRGYREGVELTYEQQLRELLKE